MIASLNGKLLYKDPGVAVIECGGVGFKCFLTENAYHSLGNVGDSAFLHTFLAVREDALDLYGFASQGELDCFKLITDVNGVGSKIGIALLSAFTADQITLYIASGDAKALTAASGVGIKLAQRIILELKDKVGSVVSDDSSGKIAAVGKTSASGTTREAVEALVSLGFSQSEASLAVSRLDTTLPVDDLIKDALKMLSRGLNN